MTKTAKQILTSLDKGEYLGKGGVDQALKEIEAIHQQEIAKARIDELKLGRHEWGLFGDRPPYRGESVSLPILLACCDDRIAELKQELGKL